MEVVIDQNYDPGVILAVTSRGEDVILVSDPDGPWFVVEHPTLDGDSTWMAHLAARHPSLPDTVSRFALVG